MSSEYADLESLEFIEVLPQEMYLFECDMVYSDSPSPDDTDQQVNDAVVSFFKEHDFGVKYKITSLNNKDGWPEIEVIGTLPSMLHFLSEYGKDEGYLTVPLDVARKIIQKHHDERCDWKRQNAIEGS